MSKEFDLVIFGATGYTGRYVIEELANSTRNKPKWKWAVAGRSTEKLKASLEQVQQYLEDDIDLSCVPIVIADVNDPVSINDMCRRTRLVVNCVGPYKFYGEAVVAACIENETHHVDLSGEIEYLETTQAKYFDEARKKGVYVVQSCGFDSIPADYGIALLKDKFKGDLNSVESYVQFFSGPEGRVVNSGTWLSAVHSVRDSLQTAKYDAMLKKEIFNKELPDNQYSLQRRLPISFSGVIKNWCTWFVGPDERSIQRTQMFGYNFLNERPVQARCYLGFDSLVSLILTILVLGLFAFLSLFSFGTYLLEKYPSFFSGGMFSYGGPSRKQVEGCSTKFTLVGIGWDKKTSEPLDSHDKPPDRKILLEISGPEPAYALTSICMVQASLVILEETEKLPLNGGILTPGAAFAKTTLKERLENRGLSFVFTE